MRELTCEAGPVLAHRAFSRLRSITGIVPVCSLRCESFVVRLHRFVANTDRLIVTSKLTISTLSLSGPRNWCFLRKYYRRAARLSCRFAVFGFADSTIPHHLVEVGPALPAAHSARLHDCMRISRR